jgi:hypothetical protein
VNEKIAKLEQSNSQAASAHNKFKTSEEKDKQSSERNAQILKDTAVQAQALAILETKLEYEKKMREAVDLEKDKSMDRMSSAIQHANNKDMLILMNQVMQTASNHSGGAGGENVMQIFAKMFQGSNTPNSLPSSIQGGASTLLVTEEDSNRKRKKRQKSKKKKKSKKRKKSKNAHQDGSNSSSDDSSSSSSSDSSSDSGEKKLKRKAKRAKKVD